jgi:hypothetical protein
MTDLVDVPNLTPKQQAMLAVWQQHTYAEFALKDPDAALAVMTENPYVFNIPSGTDGVGRAGVYGFYANQMLPSLPPDLELVSLSQTFGDYRIVEEFVIRLTHSLRMDWLLPGVPVTGRKVEFEAGDSAVSIGRSGSSDGGSRCWKRRAASRTVTASADGLNTNAQCDCFTRV